MWARVPKTKPSASKTRTKAIETMISAQRSQDIVFLWSLVVGDVPHFV